jgi:hypothetical protein
MTMTNDDVVERLDRVIAILGLANEDAIERARREIRSDEINAAILDLAPTAVLAGELLKKVQGKVKKTAAKRTVQDRIAHLVERGLLEKSGTGPKTGYRSTGIV